MNSSKKNLGLRISSFDVDKICNQMKLFKILQINDLYEFKYIIWNYIQIYKCGDGSLSNCINTCDDNETLAMSYVTRAEHTSQKKFLCYSCMIRLICNLNCYTDNS